MIHNQNENQQNHKDKFTIKDERKINLNNNFTKNVKQSKDTNHRNNKDKDKKTNENETITQLKEKVNSLTTTLQEVSAEYDNYRKRIDRDKKNVATTYVMDTIKKFLNVLDAIDKARKYNEFSGSFKLVGTMLEKECYDLGLKPFGKAEDRFNPYIHEAVSYDNVDLSKKNVEFICKEIIQTGYMFNDKLLRAAKVIVKAKEN